MKWKLIIKSWPFSLNKHKRKWQIFEISWKVSTAFFVRMKRVNQRVAKKNIKVEKIDRRRTCDKNVCGGRIIENRANTDLEDNV